MKYNELPETSKTTATALYSSIIPEIDGDKWYAEATTISIQRYGFNVFSRSVQGKYTCYFNKKTLSWLLRKLGMTDAKDFLIPYKITEMKQACMSAARSKLIKENPFTPAEVDFSSDGTPIEYGTAVQFIGDNKFLSERCNLILVGKVHDSSVLVEIVEHLSGSCNGMKLKKNEIKGARYHITETLIKRK